MKLYADDPARRARQLAGDLLLVAWVFLWVRIALVVRDATLSLAAPGEQIADAGSGLAAQLRDAGERVGGLPVVGDEVRGPFEGAGGAADRIAAAGTAQVEAVHTLAFWLALAVAAIPVLIALGIHLPLRWRFVSRARAGRRLLGRGTGADVGDRLELFALRAMARQPVDRLARVSDDPVGAWRRGDPDVVRRLAALELGEYGLSVPVLPVSADRASS